MKKALKIGITSTNYASKRLLMNKIGTAKYVDIRFYNQYFWRNLHLWALWYFKWLKLSEEDIFIRLFLKFRFIFPHFFKFDILHFFNTINYSSRFSWVVSIETCLPFNRQIINCIESKNPDFSAVKNDPTILSVIERLSSDSCKGLLAFSECSKKIQIELIDCFPKHAAKIRKKLITLHPPQERLITNLAEKGISYTESDTIRFIFIGKDFFRKGGKQMLQAFEKFKHRFKFELIIISDLTRTKENFSFFTPTDLDFVSNYIAENKGWIKHYSSLPNEEVLNLIKKSHVALLPTWMDTYGYSVLECQACGCPVITTNLRSLSEINSDEIGWIVPVPVNRLNHPIYAEINDFDLFGDILENGLVSTLHSIFNNRFSIREKAIGSLNKISLKNNPSEYSRVLKEVYEGSLINNRWG